MKKKQSVESLVFRVKRDKRDTSFRKTIQQSCGILKKGGMLVFPTDTVYGIGASVFRPQAIKRIYRLKGRSYKKPLPLLVASRRMAETLIEPLSPRLKALLKDYWPGPLTVVFNTSDLGKWVTGGKETVAIRIPNDPVALSILRTVGLPLATTSANRSGDDPAVTGREAESVFENQVEGVVNAGRCPAGEASTVLDASSFAWTLVREGAIRKKTLEKYL